MSGAFDFTVIIEGKTMREVAQFVSEKLSTDGFGPQHSDTSLSSRNIKIMEQLCAVRQKMKG